MASNPETIAVAVYDNVDKQAAKAASCFVDVFNRAL